MIIRIEIVTCYDCKHIGHSGAFTPRGARDICEHPDATASIKHYKKGKKKSEFKKEYPELYKRDREKLIDRKDFWKYHWYHRTLTPDSSKEVQEIPEWCPLKHGSGY